MTPDKLTVKAAAQLSGRSVSTIRSWLREGRLQGARASARHNAPLLIERSALVAVMQSLGIIEAQGIPAYDNAKALPGAYHVDSPAAVVTELRQTVARLEHDVEWLRGQLDLAQKRIADERGQVDSLRRELYAVGSHGKGIAGYFVDLFKRPAPAK